MSLENVREIVRELGTMPAETSRKLGAIFTDSLGSCRLALYGVYRKFALRTRGSGVRISPGAPQLTGSSPDTWVTQRT